MGRPVIFVIPHPDDETLGAGVSVAEHVAAGRDVHVLLMTRGTASTAISRINGEVTSPWWGLAHNPAVEGYQPLTRDEMGDARFREIVSALGCLGVSRDRLHFAADLIGVEPLDGQVTVDQAKQAIQALADQVLAANPDSGVVGLWTPSHTVDDNPDHVAIGTASLQLGQDYPTVWSDRRYWVLPPYWQDARLADVPDEFWDYPTNAEITSRVRNACRAYLSWAPREGHFAFGYHSVSGMFAKMDGTTSSNTPKCLIHK